ncbi:MAG: hypothetical protein HQK86_12520 [Nitrospinae bacterium]|nr:hypothetical protein [Nitrospinota bacterium]
MSGLLLLVTKTVATIPSHLRDAVFPVAKTVVFLQNGVYNTKETLEKNGINLPAGVKCFALGEDATARMVDASFEKIDYAWLVDAIDASEKTITL